MKKLFIALSIIFYLCLAAYATENGYIATHTINPTLTIIDALFGTTIAASPSCFPRSDGTCVVLTTDNYTTGGAGVVCKDGNYNVVQCSNITNTALGTMATQNSNAIAITGGTISGVDITVGSGKTLNVTNGTVTGLTVSQVSSGNWNGSITLPVVNEAAAGNITTNLYGQTHTLAVAGTYTLAAMSVGQSLDAISTGANLVSVQPTGQQMRLNGTLLTSGNKITSDGTTAAEVLLRCIYTNIIEVTVIRGIWIDGGA